MKHGEQYRFSASYPDIKGPHVVVDVHGMFESKYSYREFVKIHHRKTSTQWDLHGELFEVPVYLRLVLTPSGVRVPSRLSMDLPKMDILLEEWYSLPTCELYIERPPYVTYEETQHDVERQIDKILALAIPPDINSIHARHYFEHDPLNRIGRLFFSNIINDSYNLDLKHKKMEYNLEKEANILSKKAGLRGVWRVRSCGSRACFYSSHRDLPFLDMNLDHRVPYPDEIFAVIPVGRYGVFGSDTPRNKFKGNKGDYYWNCSIYDSINGKIVLYHGDEASPAAMDAVVEIARKIIKK